MEKVSLAAAIDSCIEYCESERVPPCAFILREFTDISDEKLEKIRRGEGASRACRRAVAKWDDFHTYFWLKVGLEDKNARAFAIFNLKGSDERGEAAGLRLVLDGVGGEEAFL